LVLDPATFEYRTWPPSKSGELASRQSGWVMPVRSSCTTLAVTARDAEEVVFGAEHGTLWLSLEPDGADTSGTQVLTPDNVYGGRP